MKQNNEVTLARVLEIQKELDVRKELYAEMDRLIVQLREGGFTCTELDGMLIELVDNFAEKNGVAVNTSYKVAGVKRFEIKLKKIKKA